MPVKLIKFPKVKINLKMVETILLSIFTQNNTIGFTELVANDALSEPKRINNNYSPKRKWLVVVNNYRAAKQRGIYPPLAIFLTDRLTFLYTFNAHRKRMRKKI